MPAVLLQDTSSAWLSSPCPSYSLSSFVEVSVVGENRKLTQLASTAAAFHPSAGDITSDGLTAGVGSLHSDLAPDEDTKGHAANLAPVEGLGLLREKLLCPGHHSQD